jgi:hypothetical protein
VRAGPHPRKILFASIGFRVGGGIACVTRCIVRALEEEARAGRLLPFDSVSLRDEPDGPAPSEGGTHRYAQKSQARFAFQVWRSIRRGDPDLVLLDHPGLARAMALPLPGLRRRNYAVFAHGGELVVITGGLRRRAVEGARAILTNSEFTAAEVRRRFPAAADRVHPVLLCIDPELVREWELSACRRS